LPTVRELLKAIETGPVGLWVGESVWAFNGLLMFHMIAVAMVTDDVETEPIILPDERLVVEEALPCITADSIFFTVDTTLFSADNVC